MPSTDSERDDRVRASSCSVLATAQPGCERARDEDLHLFKMAASRSLSSPIRIELAMARDKPPLIWYVACRPRALCSHIV